MGLLRGSQAVRIARRAAEALLRVGGVAGNQAIQGYLAHKKQQILVRRCGTYKSTGISVDSPVESSLDVCSEGCTFLNLEMYTPPM